MPAQHDVEDNADGRQQEHGDDPCDFVFGVHVRIDDIDGGDAVHDKEHDGIDDRCVAGQGHGDEDDRSRNEGEFYQQ